MHSKQTIAKSSAIEADMDIQADCAYLKIHDTIEWDLIHNRARRKVREAIRMLVTVDQELEEWEQRDQEQENPRHVRINERARERCQAVTRETLAS